MLIEQRGYRMLVLLELESGREMDYLPLWQSTAHDNEILIAQTATHFRSFSSSEDDQPLPIQAVLVIEADEISVLERFVDNSCRRLDGLISIMTYLLSDAACPVEVAT